MDWLLTVPLLLIDILLVMKLDAETRNRPPPPQLNLLLNAFRQAASWTRNWWVLLTSAATAPPVVIQSAPRAAVAMYLKAVLNTGKKWNAHTGGGSLPWTRASP